MDDLNHIYALLTKYPLTDDYLLSPNVLEIDSRKEAAKKFDKLPLVFKRLLITRVRTLMNQQ